MTTLLIGPNLKRTEDETYEVNLAATDLIKKLSQLTWADRDICYAEWERLVDALNTGSSNSDPNIHYTKGKKDEK